MLVPGPELAYSGKRSLDLRSQKLGRFPLPQVHEVLHDEVAWGEIPQFPSQTGVE
jgi:hypothetical protein